MNRRGFIKMLSGVAVGAVGVALGVGQEKTETMVSVSPTYRRDGAYGGWDHMTLQEWMNKHTHATSSRPRKPPALMYATTNRPMGAVQLNFDFEKMTVEEADGKGKITG